MVEGLFLPILVLPSSAYSQKLWQMERKPKDSQDMFAKAILVIQTLPE